MIKLNKIIILKFIKTSKRCEINYENIIENNSEVDLNIFSKLYSKNNKNYYNNIKIFFIIFVLIKT